MKAGQENFMEYETKIYVALLRDSSTSFPDLQLLFHGVQLRMISVDNVFVFLRLLFFALLLLYVT